MGWRRTTGATPPRGCGRQRGTSPPRAIAESRASGLQGADEGHRDGSPQRRLWTYQEDCGDWLIKLLAKTGFEGENLREAWAIVMRESGGREDAVSPPPTTWGSSRSTRTRGRSQPWFDRERCWSGRSTPRSAICCRRAEPPGTAGASMGTVGPIRARTSTRDGPRSGSSRRSSSPTSQWYSLYPCRPAYEQDSPLPVPELPFDSYGQQAGDAGDTRTSVLTVSRGAMAASTRARMCSFRLGQVVEGEPARRR